ncbi:EAL domain-containing protein [Dactylosporangium vinaceum]|uniref:Bifunctional diguanylate cyclase/phosphodiesterase n=1 Tax=Dactylosporangium vinaceum TaxID=53362 RepID=A0ABV5MJB0_9ACTN|nr:EAL domain-containing protein [Dactylosporangium vinaceum]UAB93624.1 EAL domain-containing protein [Dactylosporangium vinaceum]
MVRDRLWIGLLGVGLAATALWAFDVLPGLAFPLIGPLSALAWAFGPRLHDVRPRRPWQLLTAASLFFLVGIVVRALLVGRPYPVAQLGDVFSVCGFALLMAGMLSFLNRWGLNRHALLDGLIVCIGTAVTSALLFVLPAVAIPGRPVLVSVLAGGYPILDIVVLLLGVNMAFTTAVRQPSFQLLGAMMLLVFAGDLGYAVIGRHGQVSGSKLLDLPFLVAFTVGGAAALHPTARALAQATPLPVQAWSPARMLIIGPAVAAPFLLTALLAHPSPQSRWILAIGGAAIVALLLVRASDAVQSHAAAQRRFEHQATHDPLTGLPNRRLLQIMVDRRLAERGPGEVWMFYLDLDGFKLVNDSWGHAAGDRLIVQVGARLRHALPAAASVARVGGDEFVVVQRCSEPEAMAGARRIMECVERPLVVTGGDNQGAEVVVGASMGIVRADAHDSAEALMRDADTAMYQAKEQGRNRWTVFDASMRDAVRERVEIEVALRAAVAQEQLSIAYQPIVDLTDGLGTRTVGAEALVRWEHPVRGWIGPNMFIAVAEDANLISALGAWVLRESVQQLARWRDKGVVDGDFWMSVNVSPRQLGDAAFADRVAAILAQARVPAANLVLEITESVMVEGGEQTERLLLRLRELGVRISVDDFGTGFSALGYLRRHPVTGVKIDRSFVGGLGASIEDEEIVRAVVAMSSALNLAVVAEGVETTAQRDVLAALRVPLAQGWLWGRAVPASTFAAQIRARERVGEPIAVRSD